jgi:hypothetical protein
MNNIIRFSNQHVALHFIANGFVSEPSRFEASCEYETFDEDARSAREHAEYWNEEYLEDAGYLP